jgi:hypothetical protein
VLSKNKILTTFALFCFSAAYADRGYMSPLPVGDSSGQKDIAGISHLIFKRDFKANPQEIKKVYFSIIPTVGYTLSTGFTVGLSSVTTFFSGNDANNSESVINLQAFYDSRSQQTFMIQSNIFTVADQFKIVTDLRVNKYPDITYGLGGETTTLNARNIAYNYIRFYQTALKQITPKFYAGGGYCLDYHYDLTDHGTANNTVFDDYGKTTSSRSSGINVNLLFDSRTNPVNSSGGAYANIFYRDNITALGSDSRWSSIQIDLRKYIRLSEHSNNILAIWSYTWLSLNGKHPYLDLPSLGNDTYNNTGRGYMINRFRGQNMLYLESEYRFGITKNGLLGAVIFGNLQSYPNSLTAQKSIIPAGGSGIRIKMNKHTNTNLAIDYAFGTGGSRGVFLNLGEVF